MCMVSIKNHAVHAVPFTLNSKFGCQAYINDLWATCAHTQRMTNANITLFKTAASLILFCIKENDAGICGIHLQ